MSYLRDTAFVLRAEPFREQDIWLTLYGRTHGKLFGLGRGMRTAASKQRGHVEPFSKIEVMLAKGATYDKVAVAQTRASSHDLRSSLPGMAVFGSAIALVARSTEPAVPNERIYLLLDELRTLLGLPEVARISMERASLLLASFALHLLEAEGYAMDLERCRVCDELVVKESVWLSVEHGGLICRSCTTKQPPSPTRGEWIGPAILQTMRFLLREPFRSILALSAPRSVLVEVAQAVDHILTILPRSADQSAQAFLLSLG